jgi:hypothetical protein
MNSQKHLRFPNFEKLLDKLNTPIEVDVKKEKKDLQGGINSVYFQHIAVNKIEDKQDEQDYSPNDFLRHTLTALSVAS